MHRCSNSQGNMVGQCSCGMFQCQCQCQTHNSSSSWHFSMPNHTSYDETNMYPFMSSSSSVDCTLSLGTPSTRLCEDDDNKHIRSNYCWDLLQQNNNAPSYNSHQPTKASRGSNGNSSNNNSSGNDTLLARRCANCDTTSTPLWRNGPRGPKSLCNACGIRFKKEERRATAANANNNSSMLEQQQQYHGYDYDYQHNNSWVNHHSQNQKMSCFSPLNEFRFIEDNDRDSDTGMPYLSWRLNVADRPASLVHDFTR